MNKTEQIKNLEQSVKNLVDSVETKRMQIHELKNANEQLQRDLKNAKDDVIIEERRFQNFLLDLVRHNNRVIVKDAKGTEAIFTPDFGKEPLSYCRQNVERFFRQVD